MGRVAPALVGGRLNPYVSEFTQVFIQILMWSVIARSLLSWFPIDQSSPIAQMLHRVTDPLIEPIRRVMPNTGMIDLSPLACIFVLLAISTLVRSVTVPY